MFSCRARTRGLGAVAPAAGGLRHREAEGRAGAGWLLGPSHEYTAYHQQQKIKIIH